MHSFEGGTHSIAEHSFGGKTHRNTCLGVEPIRAILFYIHAFLRGRSPLDCRTLLWGRNPSEHLFRGGTYSSTRAFSKDSQPNLGEFTVVVSVAHFPEKVETREDKLVVSGVRYIENFILSQYYDHRQCRV